MRECLLAVQEDLEEEVHLEYRVLRRNHRRIAVDDLESLNEFAMNVAAVGTRPRSLQALSPLPELPRSLCFLSCL